MFICLRLRSLAAEDLVYTKKFLLLRLPYQEALNSSAVVRHLERTGVQKVKTDSRKKVKKMLLWTYLALHTRGRYLSQASSRHKENVGVFWWARAFNFMIGRKKMMMHILEPKVSEEAAVFLGILTERKEYKNKL